MKRAATRSILLALGLWHVGPRDAEALDPRKALSDYSLTAWQAEDGLPHDAVQALGRTRDGYLWIGTVEGLARFDGVGRETRRAPEYRRSREPARWPGRTR